MLSLARHLLDSIVSPTVSLSPPHFRIADVLAYLEDKFADPSIELSSVARHAGVSPAYLARLLKSSTGLTFLQHLRHRRIRYAEQLLLTTMLSIKEIAAECGYSASGSLGRDFNRVHQCTASEWRLRHRTASDRVQDFVDRRGHVL